MRDTAFWKWLLGIVAIALVLRFAYWATARDDYYYSGISATYANMGWNWRHGCGLSLGGGNFDAIRQAQSDEHRLVDPADYPAALVCEGHLSNYRMPAYPIALGVSFWLFDSERYRQIQLFQILVDGILGVVVVYGIARHFLTGKYCLLAPLSYAVFAPAARLSVVALPDAFMSVVFLVILYGVLEIRRRILQGRFSMAGAMLLAAASAFGAYLNGQVLFVPLLFVVAAALVDPPHVRLRMITVLVTVQILVIMLMIPWGLHSQAVTGRFSLSRNWVWFGLWESLGEFPNPWGFALNDKEYIQWLSDRSVGYQSPESERITSEYILRTVVRDTRFPVHAVSTVARRVPQVVLAVASDALPDEFRNALTGFCGNRILGYLVWFTGILIFVGAFGGYFILWRQRRLSALAYLMVLPSFVTLFVLVFHVEARYVIPGISCFPVLFAILIKGWHNWGVGTGIAHT